MSSSTKSIFADMESSSLGTLKSKTANHRYDGALKKKQLKQLEHKRIQQKYKKTLKKSASELQVPKYYQNIFNKATTQAPASKERLERQKRLAAEAVAQDLGLGKADESENVTSDEEQNAVAAGVAPVKVDDIIARDAEKRVGSSLRLSSEEMESKEKMSARVGAKGKRSSAKSLGTASDGNKNKAREERLQILEKRERVRKRLNKRNSKGQPYLANQIDMMLRHIQKAK